MLLFFSASAAFGSTPLEQIVERYGDFRLAPLLTCQTHRDWRISSASCFFMVLTNPIVSARRCGRSIRLVSLRPPSSESRSVFFFFPRTTQTAVLVPRSSHRAPFRGPSAVPVSEDSVPPNSRTSAPSGPLTLQPSHHSPSSKRQYFPRRNPECDSRRATWFCHRPRTPVPAAAPQLRRR